MLLLGKMTENFRGLTHTVHLVPTSSVTVGYAKPNQLGVNEWVV